MARQHNMIHFFYRQFRFTNPISPAFTTAGVQNCNHKLTEIPRTASEIRHRFQEQAMSTCLRCAWVVRTEYMMAVICDCETRIRQTDRLGKSAILSAGNERSCSTGRIPTTSMARIHDLHKQDKARCRLQANPVHGENGGGG